MMRRIAKFLMRNLGYKIAALIIALIVWGIIQGEEVVEFNRRIKVSILVDDNFAVKGKPYRYMEATLRGPRVLLGEIANRPIEAKIRIPAGQVGSLDIPFEKELIKDWDPRIRVVTRESFISVLVDQKVTREVPIREVLQGVPAEGYFVERVFIKPEKVKVTGVRADVDKLTDIVTEAIDITRINETKTFTVGLANANFEATAFSDSEVKVTVQVADSRINQRFSAIPVESVGGGFVANIQPRLVSIVIQGTPSVLSFINKSDLRAFVDLTDLKPGHYDRSVQVKIPADTVLIEAFPQKVQVDVTDQVRR